MNSFLKANRALGYNLGSDDASLWGTGRGGGEKVRGNTLLVPGHQLIPRWGGRAGLHMPRERDTPAPRGGANTAPSSLPAALPPSPVPRAAPADPNLR